MLWNSMLFNFLVHRYALGSIQYCVVFQRKNENLSKKLPKKHLFRLGSESRQKTPNPGQQNAFPLKGQSHEKVCEIMT
jgi:hypothetical protein